MKLSLALKRFLTEKLGTPADAADEVFRKAMGDGIASGAIDPTEVATLAKSEATEAEDRMASIVQKAVASALAAQAAAMAGSAGQIAPATSQVSQPEAKAAGVSVGQKALASAALAGGSVEFDADPSQVRVKSAAERYHHAPSNLTWDKSPDPYLQKSMGGRQLQSFTDGTGRVIEAETERTKAVSGVWLKHKLARMLRMKGIAPRPLSEHEQDLLQWAVHNVKFTGPVGYSEAGGQVSAQAWYDNELLAEPHRKALLDDGTSGGLEAVPIWFDDAVISTPLLEGQLYPLVDVVDVTRRRIEGVSMANPTIAWGTAEGTAITPFDTTGFVAAFDNTIFPVTGAIDIGNDFLSDSPINVGAWLRAKYGEVFRSEMDKVIAVGSGTNQPTGVFTTAGVTSLTPGGGAGAAAVVGDYEALAHTVDRAFLDEAGYPPNSRAVFIGTQTSYRRVRGLPVGTSDARRLFGMDQFDYSLMGYRYRTVNAVGNAKIGFFCMNRYRLYRRQGLEITLVSDDRASVLASQQTLVVRARFGGNLTHSGAGAKSVNAQA